MNDAGSDASLLRAWERTYDFDPQERALVMLSAASGEPLGTLRQLPLGSRDRRLFALRKSMFGSRAVVGATCAACVEPLELDFDLNPAFASAAPAVTSVVFDQAGRALTVRMPTTDDLLAVAREHPDVASARAALIERCAGESIAGVELDAAERLLSAADPVLEIDLDAECPQCRFGNRIRFDIGTFLCAELAVRLERLLETVATLARAYGWAEREILALPATRREAYLRLALQ